MEDKETQTDRVDQRDQATQVGSESADSVYVTFTQATAQSTVQDQATLSSLSSSESQSADRLADMVDGEADRRVPLYRGWSTHGGRYWARYWHQQ